MHLAVGSLDERGGGGATLEDDSTLGCLELALIWAALYLRKVAPIRAIMWTGSDVGKSSKPKCNKIQWIKIEKKRAWAEELFLWTSTKEWMNRWGKLIRTFCDKEYKNAHLSIGIMCKWEMGQIEWQEICKKR